MTKLWSDLALESVGAGTWSKARGTVSVILDEKYRKAMGMQGIGRRRLKAEMDETGLVQYQKKVEITFDEPGGLGHTAKGPRRDGSNSERHERLSSKSGLSRSLSSFFRFRQAKYDKDLQRP